MNETEHICICCNEKMILVGETEKSALYWCKKCDTLKDIKKI